MGVIGGHAVDSVALNVPDGVALSSQGKLTATSIAASAYPPAAVASGVYTPIVAGLPGQVTRLKIDQIFLCNTDTSARTVTIARNTPTGGGPYGVVGASSTVTTYAPTDADASNDLFKQLALAAGETVVIPGPIALFNGQVLNIFASSANVVNAHVEYRKEQ